MNYQSVVTEAVLHVSFQDNVKDGSLACVNSICYWVCSKIHSKNESRFEINGIGPCAIVHHSFLWKRKLFCHIFIIRKSILQLQWPVSSAERVCIVLDEFQELEYTDLFKTCQVFIDTNPPLFGSKTQPQCFVEEPTKTVIWAAVWRRGAESR